MILSLVLMAGPVAAFDTAHLGPCGTPGLLPELALQDRIPAGFVPTASLGPAKSTRDSYGVPNSLESDNFVLRWGNSSPPGASDRERILEVFEESWRVEIEEMDHPQPPTTSSYKLNVYIGDTGSGAPSAYGAAGYFNTDSSGYPMIVLAENTVTDEDYGEATVPHEFYHAVQYGTGSFDYDVSGPNAWLWEASASWIEVEVLPDDPTYAGFLFGFALLPYLEVNFFDYPDTGQLQEYHQYGAFIFMRYLAEVVGDWEIIRNTWVEPRSSDSLRALRREVEDLGVDFDEAFMDFVARNVTWDYAHGDWYAWYVDYYADAYGSQDQRIVGEIDSAGTSGWESPPNSERPHRYGANVWHMDSPDAGDVIVSFEGDSTGSRGEPAEWGLTVVTVRGSTVDYEVIELSGGSGEANLGDLSSKSDVYLVVGAWSDDLDFDETFDYQLQVEVGGSSSSDGGGSETGGDEGGGEGGESGGGGVGDYTDFGQTVADEDLVGAGGCSTTVGAAGAGWILGLLGLMGLRRRR